MTKQQHTAIGMPAWVRHHTLISMILFSILIGSVSFIFKSMSKTTQQISSLNDKLILLERFQTSLPNVLLSLNNVASSRNDKHIAQAKQASDHFLTLYTQVALIPSLQGADLKKIKAIHDLMLQVIKISESMIHTEADSQANNSMLLAQNLTLMAQTKLQHITTQLTASFIDKRTSKQEKIQHYIIINIGSIILISFIMIFFNRRFMNHITKATHHISDRVKIASDELSTKIDKQGTIIATQVQSADELTLELKHLSDSAKKITTTTASVERIAAATASHAEEGSDIAYEVFAYMERIRQHISLISEKNSYSGRKSEQIMVSLDSLHELADETHLLALNASIESAAAGEFGKRFAVVAGEIRRLSERARQFTEELQVVAHDANQSTQASIDMSQSSLEEMNQGIKLTQQACETLNKTKSMSEKTSQAVGTISHATKRQDQESEDFSLNMQKNSNLFQNSTTQIRQSREACQRLHAIVDELQTLI